MTSAANLQQGDRIIGKSQNTKKNDKKKPAKTMKEKKQAKKDKKDRGASSIQDV